MAPAGAIVCKAQQQQVTVAKVAAAAAALPSLLAASPALALVHPDLLIFDSIVPQAEYCADVQACSLSLTEACSHGHL